MSTIRNVPRGVKRVRDRPQYLARLRLVVDRVEGGDQLEGVRGVKCRGVLDLEASVGKSELVGFPCSREQRASSAKS